MTMFHNNSHSKQLNLKKMVKNNLVFLTKEVLILILFLIAKNAQATYAEQPQMKIKQFKTLTWIPKSFLIIQSF